MSRKICNCRGLTLVELLVALFLVALLMVILVSSNLFVKRFLGDWEDNNALYEDGRFILNTLEKDLAAGTEYESGDSAVYLIKNAFGDTVEYRINENRLYRQGKALTAPGINCRELILEKTSFENPNPDNILTAGNSRHESYIVSIRLILARREMLDTLETSIRFNYENIIP